MPSLYKKFFEQVPLNNITEFKANNGVNIIQFMIPSVQGATLSTQDLMFSGNLQVNTGDNTPYKQAEFGAGGISLDSVLGMHGIIDRVDLISARGNTLLEQRLNYQLISKWQRGVQAESNLENGRFNSQQLCSSQVRGTRNFLGRDAIGDNGQDFAMQLNTGLMKDNGQVLNLGALGGLIVKIYMSEPVNAFFNIDPAQAANTIGADFNYTLKNIKLFGRYNYMTSDVINGLSGVQYRKVDNLLSVVQSSNDTLTNMPQVSALHKMMYVFQPNSETANNKDVNNTAVNMLVGLKKYLLSMNGVRMPLDYEIDINPQIQALPTDSGTETRVSGNAEQQYLAISALNDQFPPTHSLSNAKNQAQALSDQFTNTTESCLNVDLIGMNYSFNFAGYTVAVPNDLMSINVESGVETNDVNLPDGVTPATSRDIRGQAQTQNLFIEYDSQLNYANMMSAR